ncbi:MAG: hypothetical protein IJK27_00520 [Bacilli bacterium]|nr:hypothetical protein [Bacilli bacterium]
MQKIKLLLMISLSASLGLVGCKNKKSSSSESSEPEVVDSNVISAEAYKAEMTDRGFFIHQNVTYSGTAAMGMYEAPLITKIADNVVESSFGDTETPSNSFKFDYSTLSEGKVYTQAYTVEPGGDFYGGDYKCGMFDVGEISTESSYILVVGFDKISYDEATKTYNLIEPVTVGVGHDEMLINELSYQFINGKLDSYKAKFGPKDQPMMGMNAELKAINRGTTTASFPLIKHVNSGTFNDWVSKYTKFQFESNVTLEIESNIGGEVTQRVVKFDNDKIDELICDKDGEQIDHNYYKFDKDSYKEDTHEIDFDVYYFSESTQEWYTIPSSGDYLNVVKFRAELLDFSFNQFNFDKDNGVYNLKEDTAYTKNTTDYVCKEYQIAFLYNELQSYSYVSYEAGFVGEEDHIYSVSVKVKNIGSTSVTLPDIE